jgi:hypothetical protein
LIRGVQSKYKDVVPIIGIGAKLLSRAVIGIAMFCIQPVLGQHEFIAPWGRKNTQNLYKCGFFVGPALNKSIGLKIGNKGRVNR